MTEKNFFTEEYKTLFILSCSHVEVSPFSFFFFVFFLCFHSSCKLSNPNAKQMKINFNYEWEH